MTLDLAVVGGGVAGSYVAYRAAQRHPEWTIRLFERSSRIGGRLLSLPVPHDSSQWAEMGGMRFRSSQPLVARIAAELGLATRPFLTVHDDNRFVLRGRTWRAGEPDAAVGAYRLGYDEAGKSAGELLLMACDRVVPGALTLTDEAWADVKATFRFRGRPLREWSMRDALAAVLSPEAHRYVVDGFGYTTLFADTNAADVIPWLLIETRPEAENRTLVDGMERLPRELARRLVERGGSVHLDHELQSIRVATDAEGRARFRLAFTAAPDIDTSRLVLALPKAALEHLAERSPLIGAPALARQIGSVTGSSAAKLYLLYDQAWWRQSGFAGRRTVSDVALSKTYYFDDSGRSPGGPHLLLASYSDGANSQQWAGMGSASRPDRASYQSRDRWHSYPASPAQVREAIRLLCVAHDGTRPPESVGAAFVEWSADALGAAWHTWNTGVDSTTVLSRMAQPYDGLPLSICNEAYASSHGWVEGALEAAERSIACVASAGAAPVG